MIAHGLSEWINGRKEPNHKVMVLVVLAATALTIKLSNLVDTIHY